MILDSCYFNKDRMYSLTAIASSLYALIVCLLPSGQTRVTITKLTSASEAKTAGCTLSIVQFLLSSSLIFEMVSCTIDNGIVSKIN